MKQHISATATVFILLFASLVTAIMISGCAQYGQQSQQAGQEAQQAQPPAPPAAPSGAEKIVEITARGFSPETLTTKSGDKVTFLNRHAAPHWPASAVHPTHAVYPESGGCIGSNFDACKSLAQGESFTFTFNEKGSWEYHDHLNPSLWGTIVVE